MRRVPSRLIVFFSLACIYLWFCGCDAACNSPNVRTVIFRQADAEKECWTREDLALLFTRRMAQELIPRKKPRGLGLLLEYLKLCLETVKTMATTKRTHALIITAVADTLGGYLQAFGLPMARESYYEGQLPYGVVRQLHELQTAFKKLLRTDGGGWTRPIKVRRSSGLYPIIVPKEIHGNPCSFLITKYDVISDKEKKKKDEEHVEIILPFLDDVNNPTAIALPFKERNLYSLSSKCSSNILVKYYTRVVQCLIHTYGTCAIPDCGPSSVPQAENFMANFNNWLTTYVKPRLHDDVWYAGFGSVWRILESLRRGGAEDKQSSKDGTCQMQLDTPEEVCEETSKLFYIIIIAIVFIAFWIIVILLCLLYKCMAKKDVEVAPPPEEEEEVEEIVEEEAPEEEEEEEAAEEEEAEEEEGRGEGET